MRAFIARRNPVIVLGLGLTPAVAITTYVENALALGAVVFVVLLGSTAIQGLLKDAFSRHVRRLLFLLTTALLVTVAELLIEMYSPELRERLGIFLPLTAVNCMILDAGLREEEDAEPQVTVGRAAGLALGFIIVLTAIALIREVLGSGTITLPGFGTAPVTVEVPLLGSAPLAVMSFAVGGFIVLGYFEALLNWLWKEQRPDAERGTVEESNKVE